MKNIDRDKNGVSSSLSWFGHQVCVSALNTPCITITARILIAKTYSRCSSLVKCKAVLFIWLCFMGTEVLLLFFDFLKSCLFTTTLDSYNHTRIHLGTITFIWFARQQSTLRLFHSYSVNSTETANALILRDPEKRFKANETKQFNARWACLKNETQSHREKKKKD